MYQADRTFMSRLKALDKNLGCKFEPGHCHFVITYRRPIGDDVPILLIEGKNGEFRQPDERDILALQQGDTHRVPARERMQQVAAYMERDREDKARARRSEIRDMTKDSKIQLSRALARAYDSGKHNSQFRRIQPRPAGRVF